MIIESTRLIAIFDLDGVLVENPKDSMGSNNTITSSDYWERHWKAEPDTQVLQHEMVDMAGALVGANYQVIILTARPEVYRPWTVRLLRRMGLLVSEEPRKRISSSYGRPALHMLGGNEVPQSSAQWKQDTVAEWLRQGARIQFMVEDYRWNAEAVRAVVPVLLYERKKPSKHLLGAFSCCGGLARCWCPEKQPSQAVAASHNQ